MRPVIEKYNMGFKPFPHQDEFSPLFGTVYYATGRPCDCGTVLGSHLRQDNLEAQENMLSAETDKLRRKGWSEAKIARWSADKEKAAIKKHQPEEDDLTNWLLFLPALLETEASSWYGFFYHWYEHSRHVSLIRTEDIHKEEITAEWLLTIEPDVLYRLSK